MTIIRVMTIRSLATVKAQLSAFVDSVEGTHERVVITRNGEPAAVLIIELAENEYRRAKRLNHSLTIVMMDINNFKQINDNYGHALGDQALRLTASAMQAVLRVGVDWIGRFGGDEFVIILPETDPVQVENIIFRLRENVKASTQNLSEGLSMVTISVGTADLVESIQSLDELLESADQAMYLDKKQSR